MIDNKKLVDERKLFKNLRTKVELSNKLGLTHGEIRKTQRSYHH